MLEVITIVVDGAPPGYRWLNILSNYLGFGLTPAVPLCLVYVLDKKSIIRRVFKAAVCCEGAYLLFLAATLPYGLVFSVSRENLYARGAYFYIYVAMYFAAMLYLMVATVRTAAAFQNRSRTLIYPLTLFLGAEHGIKGVLADRLFDMGQEDPEELRLLKYTPSSALGSCRYKIADPELDDTDYKRILEVFKKHDVRYFFYNGGNDSMDTCNKINQYLQSVGYDCRVMGVPKTIDNDLFGTDHCPGYASAAKYIATSIMEVYQDAHVYDTGMIVVVEIMGRHAGWLTAASALAGEYGAGPDLIYLPETDFSMPDFIEDVKRIYQEKGNCIVAVSEGIHYENGDFVSEA